MKKNDQTSKLLGIDLFSSNKQSLLENITRGLESKTPTATRPILVFTPNPEQVVLAARNPDFSQILPQVDYLLPDGVGLVWASRVLSPLTGESPLAERIAGVDVCQDLLAWAAKTGDRCLLLGGRGYEWLSLSGSSSLLSPKKELVGESEVWRLEKKPELYWSPGYQDIAQPTVAEEKMVKNLLKELKPDLVFVAFGAPHQEQWVIEHLPLLTQSKVKLVMVVGGSFDFLLGKTRRAPRWVQGGGEWLFRLLEEPWRWQRQLKLLVFVKMVFQAWIKLRFSRSSQVPPTI